MLISIVEVMEPEQNGKVESRGGRGEHLLEQQD